MGTLAENGLIEFLQGNVSGPAFFLGFADFRASSLFARLFS